MSSHGPAPGDQPPDRPRTENAVELSVIVPAFNAASTIEAQLDALLAQEWEGSWEILISDNGSSDDTLDVVDERARREDRIRVVSATDRRGPSYARNVAAGIARGESLAFCDADDVVGPGWLAAMGGALRQHALVTGPQEYERLNEAWLHGIYGTKTATGPQFFAGIIPFGPTANLGIRRDLFTRLGGFDTSIDVGEDIDLCLRAWLDDVDLVFVPEAVVHYRYRSSLRGLWKQAYEYGTAGPAIARKLSVAGRSTPPRISGAKNYLWLVRRLPSLRHRSGRARWIVVAGGAVGRLVGSVRARRLML